MPMIVIVLNNFEAFMELFGNEYEDLLLMLTRECVKCRIVFIVTVSSFSGMRYRLSQNLKQKIVLQLNNSDDYFTILEGSRNKKFLNTFGRGLIPLEGGVFEFQTAMFCKPEEYYEKVKETINSLNEGCKVFAEPIRVLPDKVRYGDVKNYCDSLTSVPLGISKRDLKVYCYNFQDSLLNLVVSKNAEKASQYVLNILKLISQTLNVNVGVLDAVGLFSPKKGELHERFQNVIAKVQEDKAKRNVIAILGVDKFISEYEKDGDSFENILYMVEQIGNCSIILVENDTKIKNYEYNEWYKNYINKENGIWIGNGIDNQYVINVTDRYNLPRCDCSFGYAIKQGNPNMIKLLEMDGDEEDSE